LLIQVGDVLPLSGGAAPPAAILEGLALWILPSAWGFMCGLWRRKAIGLPLAFTPFVLFLLYFVYDSLAYSANRMPLPAEGWFFFTFMFLLLPLGAFVLSHYLVRQFRRHPRQTGKTQA